jgi:hypothetical protein
VRPGALTQAARSAASRQGNAGARSASPRPEPTGARNADRRRAARAAAEAVGDRRVTAPSRPPRRVSGPAKGKDAARRAQGTARATRQPIAAGATREPTGAGATREPTRARAARQATAARSSRQVNTFLTGRPAHALGAFATGSAAVAAAVALPLRRPFIGREPAPRPAPVPRPAPDTRRAKGGKPATGIARGVGAFVVSLPDHTWLDKVVRGRAWIPLLGVLLVGIVAAQVEILKLGANMGRSLEQTTTLTSQNELLRESVASLSDDQRIERLATNMGMVLPPPGAVGYLGGGAGNVNGALTGIHAPDAAGFMALAPSNGALVTGAGTSMLPTSSGVLEQAGTPGSATPTSTPSPTSTVPSAGTSTSGTSTSSTASSGQAGSAGSQAPPAEPPPPASTQTSAGDSQTSTGGAQSTTGGAQSTTDGAQSTTGGAQTTDPQSSTTEPPSTTGAAAIQPGTSTSQQGTGG